MIRASYFAGFVWIVVVGSGTAVVAQSDGPETGASGRRISLQLDKSPIERAFRMIADHGGLNVVVGPGVEGDVTVALENVPVQTALKAVAVNNGFRYTVDDNVITISAPNDEEKKVAPPTVKQVFRLRSADAQDVKDVLLPMLSPGIGHIMVFDEDSGELFKRQSLGDLSGTFEEEGSSTTTNSNNQNQQSGSQRLQLNSGGGRNRFSRTLVVIDVASVVSEIAAMIEDLDKPPPQVLIEARLVEMTTSLQRQLGIDWNIEIFANGPVLNHMWPIRNRAGFATGSQIERNFSGFAHNVSGLALGAIDFSRFNAVLRANQDDNAIRLLANPRMLVINNHPSSILVGERYPIFEANITDFGTVTEAFDTYIPIGIQLEVKPTIMSDGRISMFVHPTISSLGDDVVGTTGLRVARVNTREVSTRIVMRDGETIVLGGLISDRKIHTVSKVPGLGDVPILSALFRQENPTSERIDLLVFLTARAEGAKEMSQRDREVFDKYRPHFKHVERLQDVPLHFEIPTEYEPPRPMFSDPPIEPNSDDDFDDMPVIMEPEDSNGRVKANAAMVARASDPAIDVEPSGNAENTGNLVAAQTVSAEEAAPSGDAAIPSHSCTDDEIKTMYDEFFDEQARLNGEMEGQFGHPIDPAGGPFGETDAARISLSDELNEDD